LTDQISYGRRLSQLADERGTETAVIFAAADGTDHPLSWVYLDQRSNQMARRLMDEGVSPGDRVVVALHNSPEHLFCTFAAWKLGASVLPLRSALPEWERKRILEVAAAQAVIGDWEGGSTEVLRPDDVAASVALDDSGMAEDHVPEHARLIATSGSTGTPKIIVTPSPGIYGNAAVPSSVLPPSLIVMTTSPLYHTNGFSFCYPPILNGGPVVLMEHFDAARAVSLIEEHRVQMTVLVPTML
jgi:bile acid-coenzyme A ligase